MAGRQRQCKRHLRDVRLTIQMASRESEIPRAASSPFRACSVRLGVCAIRSVGKARCGSSTRLRWPHIWPVPPSPSRDDAATTSPPKRRQPRTALHPLGSLLRTEPLQQRAPAGQSTEVEPSDAGLRPARILIHNFPKQEFYDSINVVDGQICRIHPQETKSRWLQGGRGAAALAVQGALPVLPDGLALPENGWPLEQLIDLCKRVGEIGKRIGSFCTRKTLYYALQTLDLLFPTLLRNVRKFVSESQVS